MDYLESYVQAKEDEKKLKMARAIKKHCTNINQCEDCVFFDDKSHEQYNHCLISSGVNWPQHWQI